MDFRKSLPAIVFALAFFTLTAFDVQIHQVGNAAVTSSINVQSAVQEACAGPCSRRGCDGTNDLCTSYTAVEIGNIRIIRDCEGTPLPEEGDS